MNANADKPERLAELQGKIAEARATYEWEMVKGLEKEVATLVKNPDPLTLLQKQDLTKFYDDSSQGEGLTPGAAKRTTLAQLTPDNLKHLQSSLLKTCKGGIGSDYFEDVLNNTFENFYNEDMKYDFIFIVKTREYTTALAANDKLAMLGSVVGFMVTEIGECKIPAYVKIPVLNLICGSAPNASKILLFYYLYVLKKKGFGTGLLELAASYMGDINRIRVGEIGNKGEKFDDLNAAGEWLGKELNITSGLAKTQIGRLLDGIIRQYRNYEAEYLPYNYGNLPGLCLYNKFGFRDSPEIWRKGAEDCFGTLENLPMTCDLSKFGDNDLILALTEGKDIQYTDPTGYDDFEPLCAKRYKNMKLPEDQKKTNKEMQIKAIKNRQTTLDEIREEIPDYGEPRTEEIKNKVKKAKQDTPTPNNPQKRTGDAPDPNRPATRSRTLVRPVGGRRRKRTVLRKTLRKKRKPKQGSKSAKKKSSRS